VAGLNWVDGVLLVLVALVAWGATTRGFVQVFTGLVGFVLTLLAALLVTAPLADWLTRQIGVSELWAAPIAFLLIWLAAQIVFTAISRLILHRTHYQASRSTLNRWLAVLPGAARAEDVNLSCLGGGHLTDADLGGAPRSWWCGPPGRRGATASPSAWARWPPAGGAAPGW